MSLAKHERLLAIVDILSRAHGALTVADIRERLVAEHEESEEDIPVRSIQRDMNSIALVLGNQLRKAGDSYGGFTYSLRGSSLAREFVASVSANQVMSLHILRNLGDVFAGSSVGREFDQFVAKVREAIVQDDVSDKASSIAESVDYLPFGAYDWRRQNAALDKVVNAIALHMKLRILYRSGDGRESERTVSPLRFMMNKGMPYLAAWDIAAKDLRVFAFTRIVNAESTGSTFQLSADMQERLAQYRKNRFGVYWTQEKNEKVELEFSEMVRDQVINRHWHASQSISQNSNGSLTLRLTIPVTEELVAWIFSWQNHVTVKGPRRLVDTMRERIATIGDLYSR